MPTLPKFDVALIERPPNGVEGWPELHTRREERGRTQRHEAEDDEAESQHSKSGRGPPTKSHRLMLALLVPKLRHCPIDSGSGCYPCSEMVWMPALTGRG